MICLGFLEFCDLKKKIDIYCNEIGDEIVSWWLLNTLKIE